VSCENPKGGVTQPHRLFEHCVEHRREVAGQGIDDLQHLGGGGLLLQRLARLGEKPRILHCNDCLRCEILQEGDLLIGKWPHFMPVDAECPQQSAVLL